MTALTEQEKNLELEKNYEILADEEVVDLYAYADKREGIIWTPEEIKVLKEGLEKYGKGKWKKILNSYKEDFHPLRRLRDLNDKVKIMLQLVSTKFKNRRDFWEVDKNNNPITKMGEKVIYRAKLLFEAAKKVAYTKNYTGNGNIIFRIAYEEMGKTWVHVYSAKYNRDSNLKSRIKVRKICGQSPYRKDGM
ncbi:myb-like DNA-binding domain-containing protein [Vairimorpha necatrix]|uniref:Myb-like DNA-binding domain-containing protein n=1 Tax=Vairimorpha necatrix TaxID=6039 RepID=A0AAX4JCY0_9MICR